MMDPEKTSSYLTRVRLFAVKLSLTYGIELLCTFLSFFLSCLFLLHILLSSLVHFMHLSTSLRLENQNEMSQTLHQIINEKEFSSPIIHNCAWPCEIYAIILDVENWDLNFIDIPGPKCQIRNSPQIYKAWYLQILSLWSDFPPIIPWGLVDNCRLFYLCKVAFLVCDVWILPSLCAGPIGLACYSLLFWTDSICWEVEY